MSEHLNLNTYDQLPYPSLSYAQSHPDHLATLATLLGMDPPPVERCRVLELGCASGGNLIPMAYGLPKSHFLGIDYSGRQIAEGQQTVADLGLDNMELRCLDIMDVTADLGQFDYIIAHGIFSWVPRTVQEKVLDICKQNLISNGVAYVSYNTFPGWHMFGIVRDMMLYHTRKLAGPAERIKQARALLNFLADSVPAEDSAYGSFLNMYARFLQGELKGASDRGDAFLFHDELEEVNEPFYFYQFAERAEQHGLQYLGESRFPSMVDSNFSPEVSETLGKMAESVIELEQYMDFIRNRMFRQTMLCHQDISLSRTLKPEQLARFYIASHTQPEPEEPDVSGVSVVKFRGADGAVLSTDHPVSKSAMLCLAERWPDVMSFKELLAEARARLGLGVEADRQGSTTETTDAQVLAVNLLRAFSYSASLVEFGVYRPHMALEVSDRPVASMVARYQAHSDGRVTNLRHERVDLDELDRYLLVRLDGSQDVPALVQTLIDGPVAEGVLTVEPEPGSASVDGDRLREAMTEGVQKRLGWMARAALLVG